MSKTINDYTKLPHFERKQFPAYLMSFDDSRGIVDHIVAVMGNVDDGGDRIANGAFAKTINERGLQVKCLDQHGLDSVTRIVGKPLAMREIGRSELPPDVLTKAPSATGGLHVTTQYAMDTTRGRDVFNLVKGGFASEMSIGYDALDTAYTKENDPSTGKERTVRELKQIRLWEYSNVVFGMNPATSTLSAKGKEGEPDEAKPWGVVEEDGKYCVYKLDEDGKPTGERLGEHETEEEAMAQMRALYANEDDEDKAATRPEAEPPKEAEKAGRRMRSDKRELLGKLTDILGELRKWAEYDDDEDEDEEEMTAPERAADNQEHEQKQAGPLPAPTSTLLKLIEIEQARIDLALED